MKNWEELSNKRHEKTAKTSFMVSWVIQKSILSSVSVALQTLTMMQGDKSD